jgi:hypothetical protein
MRLLATFGFGMALASCLGPIEPTPNHCFNQDGNDFCAEKYGDERRFCGVCDFDIKDGCTAERPPEASCYAPCGDAKTLEEDPACQGVAEGSSSSDTVSSVESTVDPSGDPTTEPTGTMTMTGTETESVTVTVTATDSGPTTGGACVTSDECTDPMNPICEDMACVPCTDVAVPDDACAEKGAGTPVCRDDGACVACTPANAGACEGTTPVCDGATNECGPCGFHEQCPGTACEIATGACFSDACVVEVDGDDGADADYDNIQAALTDGCVVIVHELDGIDVPYLEALAVDGITVSTVAIVAADGEEPVVQGVGGNPALSIAGGASAYVQGLAFRNSAAAGILVDGANLYLDRAAIGNNTGGGLALANAANGQLRNCFIGGNGGGAPGSRGLHVNGSTLELLYSSVARNDAGADDSLFCSLTSTVSVRNSILVGRDSPSINCTPLTATYSVFDEAIPGEGNEAVAAINNNWFDDVFAGDLHLTGAGATQFADVAQWAEGDAASDIDGDPRVAVVGGMEHAGADVP